MSWINGRLHTLKTAVVYREEMGTGRMANYQAQREIALLEALKAAQEALAACTFEPIPHELINEAIAKIDAIEK